MTHPHLLHATAAAWSLHRSRAALAQHAAAEHAQIAAEALEAADGIRAWQPRYGRACGGHSDPAAGAALHSAEPAVRVNRWQQLADSTTATLGWLAGQLHAAGAGDPLGRLQAAIPAMQPGTCATLTRWLRDLDQRARTALGLNPDRWPLPAAPACPNCQVRMLRAQTSPPDTAAWTVICAAGCICTGHACPCGMPVRVEGVGHIWGAGSGLVAAAVAGAAPAQAA